eukprot:1351531-Amphidinium_carterae.2
MAMLLADQAAQAEAGLCCFSEQNQEMCSQKHLSEGRTCMLFVTRLSFSVVTGDEKQLCLPQQTRLQTAQEKEGQEVTDSDLPAGGAPGSVFLLRRTEYPGARCYRLPGRCGDWENHCARFGFARETGNPTMLAHLPE